MRPVGQRRLGQLFKLGSGHKHSVGVSEQVAIEIANPLDAEASARVHNAEQFAERIVELGTVSQARLAGLYQNCTALVLASFYEGFGLPLVEAMAYGKPLIASAKGALREVAGSAALTVDANSPEQIGRAFLRLECDGRVRAALAANARQRARLFSWDKAAEETAAVLRAATDGD